MSNIVNRKGWGWGWGLGGVTWCWTYPRTNRGMKQRPADIRKMKPGYQATVAAYTLLNTATDTLLVRFSKKERQAKSAPGGTGKRRSSWFQRAVVNNKIRPGELRC